MISILVYDKVNSSWLDASNYCTNGLELPLILNNRDFSLFTPSINIVFSKAITSLITGYTDQRLNYFIDKVLIEDTANEIVYYKGVITDALGSAGFNPQNQTFSVEFFHELNLLKNFKWTRTNENIYNLLLAVADENKFWYTEDGRYRIIFENIFRIVFPLVLDVDCDVEERTIPTLTALQIPYFTALIGGIFATNQEFANDGTGFDTTLISNAYDIINNCCKYLGCCITYDDENYLGYKLTFPTDFDAGLKLTYHNNFTIADNLLLSRKDQIINSFAGVAFSTTLLKDAFGTDTDRYQVASPGSIGTRNIYLDTFSYLKNKDVPFISNFAYGNYEIDGGYSNWYPSATTNNSTYNHKYKDNCIENIDEFKLTELNKYDLVQNAVVLQSGKVNSKVTYDIKQYNPYIKTPLTGNTTGTITVTESSYLADSVTNKGWKAMAIDTRTVFINDIVVKWTSKTGSLDEPPIAVDEWLKFDFSTQIKVDKFKLFMDGHQIAKIQGSNNNSAWADLQTVTAPLSGITEYYLSSQVSYRYFRIFVAAADKAAEDSSIRVFYFNLFKKEF